MEAAAALQSYKTRSNPVTLSSKVHFADLAWGHAHPGPLLVLVQLVVYHHLRLCLLKLHVIVPDIGLQ